VTDETPKPKRKRRRWIIAGALLFVVSVAAWWQWPRGDQRFVGKWTWTYRETSRQKGIVVIRANGIATFSATGSKNCTSLPWCVRRNELIFNRDHDGYIHKALSTMSPYLLRWFNRDFAYGGGEEKFAIEHIEEDRIDLRSIRLRSTKQTLTRTSN
jgi:hypothetical protein